MATKLGTKIKKSRKKQGLTLDALAVKAGLSKSYLWELENKDKTSPSMEKLRSIADVLKDSVNYYVDDIELTPEERHVDEAFFRGYQKLDSQDKEQLRKILDAFKKE